jgi:hypothetical protein
LDPNLGSGGKVTTNFNGEANCYGAQALALQSLIKKVDSGE